MSKEFLEPGLYPLTVPTGWKITKNIFFNIEPGTSKDIAAFYTSAWMFSAILNTEYTYELILSWEPEFDPTGHYVIQLFRSNPKDKSSEPDLVKHQIEPDSKSAANLLNHVMVKLFLGEQW